MARASWRQTPSNPYEAPGCQGQTTPFRKESSSQDDIAPRGTSLCLGFDISSARAKRPAPNTDALQPLTWACFLRRGCAP